MLPHDRSRAFGSRFFLAIFLYFALYINSVWLLLSYPDADALMIFESAGIIGLLGPLMPFVAALPGATLFCADVNAGFCTMPLARSGKSRYLRSKIFAAYLTGGLATMLGTLCFIVFLQIAHPQDFSELPQFIDLSGFREGLKAGGIAGHVQYYLSRLFLQFLAGGFYAMIALSFSAFYPNVALTFCAPMVLYRLISELFTYVNIPFWLNPVLLEDGSAGIGRIPTLLYALLIFGGFSVLLAALFDFRAKRRLRHG